MARCLRTRVRVEIDPIKGSRFVATAAPAIGEDAAQALLRELRDEWPDASHHCWAWRLASPAVERAGDDGEPSGSAGRPILSAIVGRDLVDTAVVVTRWFGGTKLGVGGLVRAYGSAAASALDAGEVTDWVATVELLVEHDHADTGPVERTLADLELASADPDWAATVRRTVTVPVAEVDLMWQRLADATRGRVSPRSTPD